MHIDRKKLIIFLAFVAFLALFLGLGLGIGIMIGKGLTGKQNSTVTTSSSKSAFNLWWPKSNKDNEQGGSNGTNDEKQKEITKYSNADYKYSVEFPNNWYMNNEFSNAQPDKIEGLEDSGLLAGGQTFWSNYEDINEFDEVDKPEDFHLLGLTIYKKDDLTMNQLLEKIGITQIVSTTPFESAGAKGMEFLAPGITEENPEIFDIFENNDFYFVFSPAFIGGDQETKSIMEGIVRSFAFLN